MTGLLVDSTLVPLTAMRTITIFASWSGYQLMALPIMFLARSKRIPYRSLWWGLFAFLQLRAMVPASTLAAVIWPQFRPLHDMMLSAAALVGVAFGVTLCSAYGSIQAFLARKYEDAEKIAQLHAETERNYNQMSFNTNALIELTKRRILHMTRAHHDPA
jgi:hypothetical protein